MNLRVRRNDAISKAKEYARSESWDMMMAWLERAQSYWPISELQMYYLRKIIGPYKYEELKLNRFLLIGLLFFFQGCNFLHKTHSAPSNQALPDIYSVEGVTSVDYQMIQPIRCVNSVIRVWIQTPGGPLELNSYEFLADPIGVGGGGVLFQHKVDVVGASIVVYQIPIAPTGTHYMIQSMVVTK